MNNNKKIKKIEEKKKERGNRFVGSLMLPKNVVVQIADEVVKVVNQRLIRRSTGQKNKKEKIVYPIFLDTSAIIDGRVFDLTKLGIFNGTFVILDSVLSELKAIADSKDETRRERGRKGLRYLDEVRKQKLVEFKVLKNDKNGLPVDDQIVSLAHDYKGKILTCDYNLSKKARISGVISIDIYELANLLKTKALPGEEFWVKVVQKGKGEGQGVGYLPDGTMIVVEKGSGFINKTVEVVVSRIIQTDAGKIFFAKILSSET